MKRLNHLLIGALAAMMLACGTTSQVPITGRKHSLLVSDAAVPAYRLTPPIRPW